MQTFVFSADAHVVEPPTLFLDGLPASLKDHAIHARKEGDFLITGTKDKTIYRLRVGAKERKNWATASAGACARYRAGFSTWNSTGSMPRSFSLRSVSGSTASMMPKQKQPPAKSTMTGTTHTSPATSTSLSAAASCRCRISQIRRKR